MIFSFQLFLVGINKKILALRLQNLLKICEKYLYTLKKIVVYCIPPPDGIVHHKRA
jgi:hypothetical protein